MVELSRPGRGASSGNTVRPYRPRDCVCDIAPAGWLP
jgi:hypothetical protein